MSMIMSMKHERVENLTFYLYLVCVVYICKEEDLPSLSSYGYSLIGGKILIGKYPLYSIFKIMKVWIHIPFSFMCFLAEQNMIMSPEVLYYLCKFYHKKDLPFTISKFKRSYLIFFVDSRPRADESS